LKLQELKSHGGDFGNPLPGYPPDQTYCKPSKSVQKNSCPTLEIKEVMLFSMNLKNKNEI
jgi:hypothetical protein